MNREKEVSWYVHGNWMYKAFHKETLIKSLSRSLKIIGIQSVIVYSEKNHSRKDMLFTYTLSFWLWSLIQQNTKFNELWIWLRVVTSLLNTFLEIFLPCTKTLVNISIYGMHFQKKRSVQKPFTNKQTNSSVWGVHLLGNLFPMNYSANSTEGPTFFSSYIKIYIYIYDNHSHKCYLWLMLSLLSSFLSSFSYQFRKFFVFSLIFWFRGEWQL